MVIDSDDRPVAVIEVTGVRVVSLAQVDLAHVVDEERGTPAWPSISHPPCRSPRRWGCPGSGRPRCTHRGSAQLRC
jgi:hypothetical protein